MPAPASAAPPPVVQEADATPLAPRRVHPATAPTPKVEVQAVATARPADDKAAHDDHYAAASDPASAATGFVPAAAELAPEPAEPAPAPATPAHAAPRNDQLAFRLPSAAATPVTPAAATPDTQAVPTPIAAVPAPVAASPKPVVAPPAPVVAAYDDKAAYDDRLHPAAPQPAALDHVPVADAAPAPSAPTPRLSEFTGLEVQLLAAGSADSARAAWDRLQAGKPDLFGALTPRITEANVRGKTYWRLRTGAFATVAEAQRFCAQVRAVGSQCILGF
jgi:hypothetical protein